MAKGLYRRPTSSDLHRALQSTVNLRRVLTSKKVTCLYDLMDAAYDAQLIEATSRKFGHVLIANRNSRGNEVTPMAPHEAQRYTIRSCAERANSRLKEDFGANNVMVKGHSKVTLHLMPGVVVLFADQLLRLAAG